MSEEERKRMEALERIAEIAGDWMQHCNEAPSECPCCGSDANGAEGEGGEHDPEWYCGRLWAALGALPGSRT